MPELNATRDTEDRARADARGELRGIRDIAAYARLSFKQARLALERGWLPGKQLGPDGMWISSKSEIDRAVEAKRQYHGNQLLACIEAWMTFALADHSERDVILAELAAGGELRLVATPYRAELHLIDRTGVDTGPVTAVDRPPRLPSKPIAN